MNLEGWEYLFTFGYSLDIYAKGNRRIGVDRETGEKVIEYSCVRKVRVDHKDVQVHKTCPGESA